MATCKHINEIVSAVNNVGVGNADTVPWNCTVCSVKNGLWLCLICGETQCGGETKSHHLHHFETTKHPLALEVDTLFLYCFPCQDFIDVDTTGGDVRIYRDIVPLIVKGQPSNRSQRRSTPKVQSHTEPHYSSVVKFRRARLLKRTFDTWRSVVQAKHTKKVKDLNYPTERSTRKRRSDAPILEGDQDCPSTSKVEDGSGLTGLGNVGNTCYMNAVLQILCNLDEFRDRLLQLCPVHVTPSVMHASAENKKRQQFQQGIEKNALQFLPERNRYSGPLTRSAKLHPKAASVFADKSDETPCQMRLTEEVYALLGVMWSGKLSLVIPNGFLQAMWEAVPAFKGHHQQDAQEFLTEMLDKLSDDATSESAPLAPNNELGGLSEAMSRLVRDLFHGELQSQVTCLKCSHKSIRTELFSDLSLEFPNRFQNCRLTNLNLAVDQCHVSEMLAAFTSIESLGKVYQCETCNQRNSRSDSARRRSKTNRVVPGAGVAPVRTEAEKRILISKLPKILRLHLKRFRWSAASRREKISIHVAFNQLLDVRKSCLKGAAVDTEYRLCGLVMHHGRGFHSGHYTAYCWNSKARLWLHCNDARLEVVNVNEVLAAQAYILFYSRVNNGDSQLEN